MKSLNLTKSQFLKLMKLAYIGEWVVNAHRTDDKVDEFEDVEQLIYKMADEFGFEDLIIKEADKIFPSGKLEFDIEIRKYIDEYEHDTFWHELGSRLALKEAVEIYGEKGLLEMSNEDRVQTLWNLEIKYIQEFHQNSFDNVILKET